MRGLQVKPKTSFVLLKVPCSPNINLTLGLAVSDCRFGVSPVNYPERLKTFPGDSIINRVQSQGVITIHFKS